MEHAMRACVLGSLALAWTAAAGEPVAERVTVLDAGRVVDVVNGRVETAQRIVVRGERIEAVGPRDTVAVPAGADVIDLTALTLLPGLIDTHTHLASDPTLPPFYGYGLSVGRLALIGAGHARATLLAGITTVRDVGADAYVDVALRDAIAAGDVPGPRMLVSGPAIGITGGHCDANLLAPEFKYNAEGVADGVEGVRKAVRRNVKYGVDLIKYCGTGGVFSKGTIPAAQQYTAEEVAALIDEAHMHGRRVAVHAHGAAGIVVAIKAGVDTVEHASLIDDEGIAAAKKAGTYLSMDIYNTDYTQAEGPKRGELEEFLKKDRDIAEVQRENFRRATNAGVRMTFGTDAGVYPHGDNAKQLAVMVRYGMTTLEALQAATLNGAAALGLDDDLGSITEGKYADIIAVDGDPSTDVRVVERVHFVMKNGRVYRRSASDE